VIRSGRGHRNWRVASPSATGALASVLAWPMFVAIVSEPRHLRHSAVFTLADIRRLHSCPWWGSSLRSVFRTSWQDSLAVTLAA